MDGRLVNVCKPLASIWGSVERRKEGRKETCKRGPPTGTAEGPQLACLSRTDCISILKPIFSSVTLSGGRSSKPLRDLSVWHSQCWSLLMSDRPKTQGRMMSRGDIVLLVCQEGHWGRDRNGPLRRQRLCHRGGQAALVELGYFFSSFLSYWLCAASPCQA